MDYKKNFPIFENRDLVYLDNAATTQKPQVVLDAMADFYTHTNCNIHRGPNFLSEESTVAYENARRVVADFIGANESYEVIFTRNTTESLNLLARTVGETLIEGDEVLLSKIEHHSNIVPWLQLKERKGIVVKYIPIDDEGRLKFEDSMITDKTKIVSLSGMSNSLGTLADVGPIFKKAKENGAITILDAAQLVVHSPLSVKDFEIDFMAFSGHKLYGPTGIGVLWGKAELLEKMPPFMSGGGMVNQVFEDRYEPAGLPDKFEAGTPNIAGAIGLAESCKYLNKIGMDKIRVYEYKLTEYLLERIDALDFIDIIGSQTSENRGGVVSFGMKGVHPHDIAEGLSQKNIVIRAGHHCNQILMDHFGISGSSRISFGLYNTQEDIDKTISALREIYDYFN